MRSGDIIAGRYRLAEPLGEGGLGVVWSAWQLGIERRVAIKFLKDGRRSDRERFDIEARALGRLSHPNCVTVHDFGHTDAGDLFLVMEHLEGRDLSSLRGTHLPIPDVVAITRQIVTALAYAHHQGVVHRDLKPENVFLVDTFDGQQLVKVLDFGLAKLLGRRPSDITKTGDVFGTPAYMSPEQLQGTRGAGRASDLYSVGVLLYEMIERRLPFWADTPLEIGMAHIMKPAPPLRRQGVPAELVAIVERLLMKDPSARYDSALQLFDALGTVEVPDVDSTLNLVMVQSPHETLDMPGGLDTSAESITAIDRVPVTMVNQAQASQTVEEAAPPEFDVPPGPPLELATVVRSSPLEPPAPAPTQSTSDRKGLPFALLAIAGAVVLLIVAAAVVGGDAGEPVVAPELEPVDEAASPAPATKVADAIVVDMGTVPSERADVVAAAVDKQAAPRTTKTSNAGVQEGGRGTLKSARKPKKVGATPAVKQKKTEATAVKPKPKPRPKQEEPAEPIPTPSLLEEPKIPRLPLEKK